MYNKIFIISMATVPIFMLSFSILALDENNDRLDLQEEKIKAAQSEIEVFVEIQEAESMVEVDIGWAWGDVISIDAEGAQFIISYFDYESEVEAEISLFVDEQTVFENVVDLSEIKTQDSVSVDYVVTADGKNVARLISVERQM